jgi:hypothetical protein
MAQRRGQRYKDKERSMLRSTKQLYGDKLGALDGEIGHVKDFILTIRTGRSLSGGGYRFLVDRTPGAHSPHSLGRPDQPESPAREPDLKTDRAEPSIESHKPVSRQYEEEYYRYYGWPIYWQVMRCGA